MTHIEFFIPTVVVPKQSTRIGRRRGRTRAYADPRVAANADALCEHAMRFRPRRMLTGPLRLELSFLYAWPRNEPKRGRPTRRHKHTAPDCDNLAKQVADVLQKAGFYRNDAQIAELFVDKYWCAKRGVFVQLERIAE